MRGTEPPAPAGRAVRSCACAGHIHIHTHPHPTPAHTPASHLVVHEAVLLDDAIDVSSSHAVANLWWCAPSHQPGTTHEAGRRQGRGAPWLRAAGAHMRQQDAAQVAALMAHTTSQHTHTHTHTHTLKLVGANSQAADSSSAGTATPRGMNTSPLRCAMALRGRWMPSKMLPSSPGPSCTDSGCRARGVLRGGVDRGRRGACVGGAGRRCGAAPSRAAAQAAPLRGAHTRKRTCTHLLGARNHIAHSQAGCLLVHLRRTRAPAAAPQPARWCSHARACVGACARAPARPRTRLRHCRAIRTVPARCECALAAPAAGPARVPH
jgi:hypothetical protein